MKNNLNKLFYMFLSIIFQTSSVFSIKFYLNIFKDSKSHPYIITSIYFMTYLLFIIIFYSGLPKKKKETKKNVPKCIKAFRKRINSLKLYKNNSIITIDPHEEKKEKKKNHIENNAELCNNCPNYYCIKNEVIYPSILLIIGHGINIYTLGKINIILHQMMNGSVLICLFRLIKCKEIAKIKPNKVVAGIIDVFSIISFIVYHLYTSGFEVSYLFFILFSFFSSMIICWAKFYNFKTIHRYSINFISNTLKIDEKKEKNENLIEKNNYNSINNIDDEENNENSNSNEDDSNSNGGSSDDNENNNNNKKKKNNNHYFSYEKIIFYEGLICLSFWLIFITVTSFIKCPKSNDSFVKIFICNNCTTVSGIESFFKSKEMIIFNDIQYKSKIVQYIYNYPLCSIIFIIIIIGTEFFSHFSFQKIFIGKYKTKLVVFISPIVSLIIFGIGYFGKKYSNVDLFLEQIVPKINNPSEIILCLSLFLGSVVTYLRIFEINCKL